MHKQATDRAPDRFMFSTGDVVEWKRDARLRGTVLGTDHATKTLYVDFGLLSPQHVPGDEYRRVGEKD